MRNNEETATCVACGVHRGAVETLIGRVCHECAHDQATWRGEPDEYPSDGGQAEILHGPLDL